MRLLPPHGPRDPARSVNSPWGQLSHPIFFFLTTSSQSFILISRAPTLACGPSSTSGSKPQSCSPLFLKWQSSKAAGYTETEMTVIVEEIARKKYSMQGHVLVYVVSIISVFIVTVKYTFMFSTCDLAATIRDTEKKLYVTEKCGSVAGNLFYAKKESPKEFLPGQQPQMVLEKPIPHYLSRQHHLHLATLTLLPPSNSSTSSIPSSYILKFIAYQFRLK